MLWLIFFINESFRNACLCLCHPKTSCNAISSCGQLFEWFSTCAHCNLKFCSIFLFYEFQMSLLSCHRFRPSYAMQGLQLRVALALMNPGRLGMASPLCTSSVASRIHSSFQNVSPNTIHMLCKTKHVATKSGTFFKCTSILFKRIRHLPLSIPNARSTHIRVELCTKFQWYSSRDKPSLWPLNGANIHGRQGYAASPTKQ